jgi:hypothetical protein
MTRSKTTRIALGAALAAIGAACTVAVGGCAALSDSLDGTPPAVDAGAQTTCPNDFHAQCPVPPPSYQNDILPIVKAHCLLCHTVGGLEPTENSFNSYQAIFDDRQAIEDQINECRMPPIDAGIALPTASRVLFMTWLACGAPNN